MRNTSIVALAFAAMALGTHIAHAEPTEITIRVISKDAKFIGTSMGGARVMLHDAETGQLLASGVTAGSTGNTKKIITTSRERGKAVSDDKSAKFSAVLDVTEPTLITVTATGPLAQRQSAVSVSATQWIIPGKHITGGDAWLLEIPGFVVDVINPPTHIKLGSPPQKIPLAANVTMMCGCPIEPGGLWDANRYEVAARILHNGKYLRTVPLSYAGKTSQFAAQISLDAPGAYEAQVYAYDPNNGNTGLDRVTFIIK